MTTMTLEEILKEPAREKIVRKILEENEIEFKILYSKYLKISETTARHHLKQLEKNQIVIRSKRPGTKSIFLKINPKYLETAREIFDIPRKYVYLGFAGKKGAQQVDGIISVFVYNRWEFERLVVYTPQQTYDKMKDDIIWKKLKGKFTGSELLVIELTDYKAIHKTIQEKIEKILPQYSIIADVTGLTKLHSLALYSLAQEYGLKRVYIPEDDTKNILTLP